MIVAVTLLAILALLSLLALGLIGMAIKSSGKLVIDSITVAIPPKVSFHVEYRPPDHSYPPVQSLERPLTQKGASESPGNASTSDAGPRIGGDTDTT
jgi:hypothetical protein